MITFVTGKPGDGKSMYAMRLIARSIMESERFIVTNVPVKVPELRAYLCAKGWSGDLNERLLLLRHEEVFEFYRFRSGSYVLPPSPDWVAAKEDGGRKLKRPEFIAAMQAQLDLMRTHPEALTPCEYHIDEAHDYFSAREWADTGRGLLWYASKHRHLHDEVVFYTQVMANVEKQLRGLAGETVRVRNQLRMSWGPFRKAPIFRVYHYYGAPEKTDSVTPYNQSVMNLDVNGLAKTYNSAGALNVHRSPEQITNRAPLPYWVLPLAIVAFVVLCGVALAVGPVAVGKWAGRAVSSAPAGVLGKGGITAMPASHRTNSEPERDESRRVVVGRMEDARGLMIAVSGVGWVRAVKVDEGDVLLEDGSRVLLADVRALR